MKFIYITPKTYPARSADDFYVAELAKGFNEVLQKDFLLVVADNTAQSEIDKVNHLSLGIKIKRNGHELLFYISYFLKFPFKILLRYRFEEIRFFVGDPNIAIILFFWKKIFRLKYEISSDWHMYYKTWKYAYIARNSDHLITTSERLKTNLIKEFGVHPDKIKAVYGGVDLEKFESNNSTKEQLRKELGLPETGVLISYVGFFKTMGMEKGIDTMIKSLPHLRSENIKMVLVGGKEEQIEEYRSLASSLNVQDQIMFVGVVPNDKISLYEKAMDILVIPYPNKQHFREYGFPMKVYEYMASKNPIIYSNLELIGEVLSDCGYHFIPEDSVDLARVINTVLDNLTEASEKINLAYKKVQNFTWREKANLILGL